MVRRYAAFSFFVAHATIYRPVHPQDYLVRRERRTGRHRPAELSIYHITDTFEAGVQSLKAHKAYIDGLGWENFDPAEFLEGMARQTGTRLGVPMAVGFQVYDFGWG